jgi:hypothetical protein
MKPVRTASIAASFTVTNVLLLYPGNLQKTAGIFYSNVVPQSILIEIIPALD